jgi:hypothetical protein
MTAHTLKGNTLTGTWRYARLCCTELRAHAALLGGKRVCVKTGRETADPSTEGYGLQPVHIGVVEGTAVSLPALTQTE